MTLDSTSDSTPSESTADAAAAPDRAEGSTPAGRKPARRRATRSAAPPQAPVATAEGTTASTDAPAALADSNPAAAAAVPDAAEEKPARRSRRATRTTSASAGPAADAPATPAADAAAPAPAVDDAAVPSEPEAAPEATAAKGRGRTARRAQGGARKPASTAPDAPLDVLSEFGLSAAPAAEQAPPATAGPDADALLGTTDAPRKTKRTRTTRKAAPAGDAKVTEAPEAAPAEAAEPVGAATEAPAEKKPVRRSRRATAAAGAPTTTAPAAEAPAAEVTPTADAPTVAAEATVPEADAPAPQEAPKKPARRSRRATSKAASAEAVPEPQEAAEATSSDAPAPAAAPGTPVSPAATGAGTSTPRLATTALLFQAPDPAAAPRRPRRAQSPAGPPRHVEPTPAAEAAPVAAEPRERSPKKSAAAPVASERAVDVTVEVALTGEDAAAVEEIEAIESELVAEGIELPDDAFGPEDFADLDEAEPDEPEDQAASDEAESGPRRRRRRGGRGRRGRPDAGREQDESDETTAEGDEPADTGADAEADETEHDAADAESGEDEAGSSRRRRRRRRGGRGESGETSSTRSRPRERSLADEVTALKGSTRLEAKRQRRREGRDAGRRRQIITEAEFLARREAVERSMVVRERAGRTQIAVLEDGVLVEHYVSQQSQASMAGNVYLGRVQNVLPSMEAAFIDVGKGRNAVLYAGEVNWDAAGLEGQPRRIEQALKSGDSVLVQVTKDPIGHKGARLTSQITLAGRYLVFVPGGGMTGISRKLPDTERNRLKKILKEVVPDGAGVIVRTAAEGASEEELRADVERLRGQWEAIERKSKSASAPALLQGEPDLAIRVVRDIFNDDFSSLVVEGDGAWSEISSYVEELAPDLRERVSKWTGTQDVFTVHRVDEQLAKGMDRKVWLPSGGSLVIDRTEAMTVVDVNTGKFTGSGGTLEETVTRNNLEAAEEIVRQLRLRDIGGIIVIDFIDMVLESNRDLVLRRLVECLGRDRTKHQVAEVTSLGLVQMTRKRVGQGLVEAFSETCEHCHGRGFIVHTDPIEKSGGNGRGGHDHGSGTGSNPAVEEPAEAGRSRSRRKRGSGSGTTAAKDTAITLPQAAVPVLPEVTSEARAAVKATLATIAAAAAHAHEHEHDGADPASIPGDDAHAEPGEE
ncbi:ribonuclease E [Cellulosimicrobium cellulans]|uniref:Rne/Rng family ribonuclease n=1 Tax=Cellulosimicrobium cellulans TaxID=1710 RepID=UPI0019573D47|nr:Rne/Rng family ribonuclease [Cellulosimicrobium cellulans]MBM7820528.1 ribonuclease E [Cellulosimicrobium cellulans]